MGYCLGVVRECFGVGCVNEKFGRVEAEDGCGVMQAVLSRIDSDDLTTSTTHKEDPVETLG